MSGACMSDCGYRSYTRLCPHADEMLALSDCSAPFDFTTPRAGAHLSHERLPGSTPVRWLTVVLESCFAAIA